MAIKWWERPTSRETSGANSKVLHFGLSGTDNDILAYNLALGYSPALYAGLYRTNLKLSPHGHNLWYVEVTYGPQNKKQPEEGDFSWNFTAGGGSKHITHSLETISKTTAAGKAEVDHKGAINVTENGDIEGTDVPDYCFKWTENHQLLLADYGWAYSQILAQIQGHYNDATFRGFPAGEVLLETATGGQSSKNPALLDATFNFAQQPTETDVAVGQITVPVKIGWHYAWVLSETEEDATGKKLAPRARQVNVERVLHSTDFSQLGIGT